MYRRNVKGVTLIEFLIALAVMAIAFLPLMHMFTTCLEQSSYLADMTTAKYLAHEKIETIKSSGYTQATFEAWGDQWFPALGDPATSLNQGYWRIKVSVTSNNPAPADYWVYVYRLDNANAAPGNPILSIFTSYVDLK